VTQFSTPFQQAQKHPIWVLEDSESDREILKRAFEKAEVQNEVIFFESVTSLKLTVDAFKGTVPALALLDMHLPNESGRDAVKLLSQHEILKTVPSIAFSHTGSSEDISDMYALGVSSFIKKSLSFEETLDMVKSLKNYWLESVILPAVI
jgi:DNA-binding NtrC family response regulator